MAQVREAPPRPEAAREGDGAGGPAHHPEIDWEGTARSPEFRELVRRRWAFTIPLLGFVFVWYFGFIALAGYAPSFMGESIYEGFTVGYAFALSQFVMTWLFGWLYLRQADRVFDPLARRAAKRALETAPESQRPRTTDGDGTPRTTDGDGRPQTTAGDGEVTH
jgi:uncharacterized membrane protein (DUF485 family)